MDIPRPAIGLDFGTTYSCIGVWQNGGVEIIPNEIGERTTPSVILFESKNKILVGEETLNRVCKDPKRKIYQIKRLIGKDYDEIKDLIKTFQFEIIKEESGERPLIKITYDGQTSQEFSPEQLASLIIKKMLKSAELYLNNTKITDLVITVPAYFDNKQINGIKNAVELVGDINLSQIIKEPSAASLAYDFDNDFSGISLLSPFNQGNSLIMQAAAPNILGMTSECFKNSFLNNDKNLVYKENIDTNKSKNEKEHKKILVFDLGGGTYDVSLIEKYGKDSETKCYSGDSQLGGADFDIKLMNYCIMEFSKKSGYNVNIINADHKALQRLRIACETSKKILSVRNKDNIYVENFIKDISLNVEITRANFENICSELFEKLIPSIEKVLRISKWGKKDINEIVLVGGSSKIPKIKEKLKDIFENVKINDSINPDESVAYGATILAEKKLRSNNKQLINFGYREVTPFNIGIAVENENDINNDVMEVIINRGTFLPVTCERYYRNVYNNQTTMEFKVYEGDKRYVKDNKYIDKITLTNIPRKPKGELCVFVKYHVDEDGILTLNAKIGEEQIGNVKMSVMSIRSNVKEGNKSALNKNQVKLDLSNNNLNDSINEIKEKERSYINSLKDFTKFISNETDNKKKFNFIIQYNDTLNCYLNFLEENDNTTDPIRYFYYIELLFISYSNMCKNEFKEFLDENIKTKIKENSQNFIDKISKENPFHIKQLLIHFNDIENNPIIFYNILIYCLDLLKKKGENFMQKHEKYSYFNAQKFFEECFIISKQYIQDETDIAAADRNLFNQYKNILSKCQEFINKISGVLFDEIENTKKTGNLFSNKDSLSEDDLYLLIFHFNLKINDIKAVNNNNNDELLIKSICLANIVKIEFEYLKKRKYKTLQKLRELCDDCISIVDNFGDLYKEKNWYKDINNINKEIKKLMLNKITLTEDQKKDLMEIKENLKNELLVEWANNSPLDFIKIILNKCPYEGYENDELNVDEEWEGKDCFQQRGLLANLINKYRSGGQDDGEFETKVKKEKYNIII